MSETDKQICRGGGGGGGGGGREVTVWHHEALPSDGGGGGESLFGITRLCRVMLNCDVE